MASHFLMLFLSHIIQDLGMSAVYVLEDVLLALEELTANPALKYLVVHLQDLLICNLAICWYGCHFENGTKAKAGRRHRIPQFLLCLCPSLIRQQCNRIASWRSDSVASGKGTEVPRSGGGLNINSQHLQQLRPLKTPEEDLSPHPIRSV